MVGMKILAVTFDLDDTLWPFPPIGERIERKLHDWMVEHAPRAARMFPIEEMRDLRTKVWHENPEHAHDMSALRRMTIERALRESGENVGLTSEAYEVFYDERNKVEFYPDALKALRRIGELLPIAAVTNGNADLERIGLMPPFQHVVSATQVGVAKPSQVIFHVACELLGFAAKYVLHVGDHIEMDVIGAADAGMLTCWVNREGQEWPEDYPRPDLEVTELGALVTWLEYFERED